MTTMDETVWVRRQPTDSRIARYNVDDVGSLHWGLITGGVMAETTYPTLMGYVQCDGMLEGELAHSCLHGPPPHSIIIVITRRDNPPALYRRLANMAGPKPPGPVFGRPHLERLGEKRFAVWRWSYRERRRIRVDGLSYLEAIRTMREWRREAP